MSEKISYDGLPRTGAVEQKWEPVMYAVVLYNDDYTTMEFVIDLLVIVFHKTAEEAVRLMLEVHESGKGVAGIYMYDIAATKRRAAEKMAAEQGFPLKVTIEEAH